MEFVLWNLSGGVVVVERSCLNRMLSSVCCFCCGIVVVESSLWNYLLWDLCCGIFVVETSLLNGCCGV